jgi:hypothetical protein
LLEDVVTIDGDVGIIKDEKVDVLHHKRSMADPDEEHLVE